MTVRSVTASSSCCPIPCPLSTCKQVERSFIRVQPLKNVNLRTVLFLKPEKHSFSRISVPIPDENFSMFNVHIMVTYLS